MYSDEKKELCIGIISLLLSSLLWAYFMTGITIPASHWPYWVPVSLLFASICFLFFMFQFKIYFFVYNWVEEKIRYKIGPGCRSLLYKSRQLNPVYIFKRLRNQEALKEQVQLVEGVEKKTLIDKSNPDYFWVQQKDSKNE